MLDQEQELASTSLKLNDLRGNVGQVMEMFQVIKAKLGTQVTVISEVSGSILKPQPAGIVPTMWPPYGLPSGFTPPFEGASGVMQSIQQAVHLPIAIEAHPVVHIVALPIIYTHVQPHFKDQHQIYHAPESFDEEEGRREDIKGIKENYLTFVHFFTCSKDVHN